MKFKLITALSIALFILSCNNNPNNNNNSTDNTSTVPVNTTPVMNYTVMNILPHDTTAYTEGFLFHEGKLYESTGHAKELKQTKSLFGEVDLKTGKINAKVTIDSSKYFGEGIVFIKDKVYQLTYTTKIGFVYDAKTFKQVKTFTFPSDEGWGMTTDSTNIIMSDGTNNLTYLDPETFKTLKIISVKDENGPVLEVNELEFINGFIYANVYRTNTIIKINPESGTVVSKIDLTNLAKEQKFKFNGAEVMNGIAYDKATDKIYITGKLWPNIYEIKFAH